MTPRQEDQMNQTPEARIAEATTRHYFGNFISALECAAVELHFEVISANDFAGLIDLDGTSYEVLNRRDRFGQFFVTEDWE